MTKGGESMADWGSDPEWECQECFYRWEIEFITPDRCPKCACEDVIQL